MFTGLDPDSTNGTKAVGRLLAAGLLEQGKEGLRPSDRWQREMLRELSRRPAYPIDASLGHTLQGSFPGTPDQEIDVMARIMLFIEAREAGWKGE